MEDFEFGKLMSSLSVPLGDTRDEFGEAGLIADLFGSLRHLRVA